MWASRPHSYNCQWLWQLPPQQYDANPSLRSLSLAGHATSLRSTMTDKKADQLAGDLRLAWNRLVVVKGIFSDEDIVRPYDPLIAICEHQHFWLPGLGLFGLELGKRHDYQ